MQIIITGMHRSGTSLVARLVGECGAYLGRPEEMMPAKPDNPAGFWEHLRAYDINMAILEAAGVTWDTAIGGELELLSHADRAEAAAQIHEFVGEMSSHGVWAVKDPRLALTFRLWRPMLSDPVVVWCVRHPVEIGVSLEGRNGFPIHLGVSLWEAYTVEAMRNFTGVPVVVASYGDLFLDPVTEVRKLVKSVNATGRGEIKVPSEKAITSVIKERLRRSSISPIPEDQFFTGHRQRLWERSQISEGWEATDPAPELSKLSKDAILLRRQLVRLENEPVPGPDATVHDALEGFEARSAERSVVLDSKIVEVGDRCDRILTAVDERFRAQSGELAKLKTRLVEMFDDRSTLRTALDARGRDLEEARSNFAELQARFSKVSEASGRELAQAHSDIAELQARFSKVSEANGRELAQAHSDIDELQARFSEVSEANGRELAQARSDFAELQARFSEVSEASGRELAQARAELARQQSVLADIRSSTGGKLLHWWWRLRARE